MVFGEVVEGASGQGGKRALGLMLKERLLGSGFSCLLGNRSVDMAGMVSHCCS